MFSDASLDGLGVVPGAVDVVEADRVDLVESSVEVDQEPKVVELKKAPSLLMSIQGIEGCCRRMMLA